jgi:hypothetical protein
MLRGIALGYWESIFNTRVEPVSLSTYALHRLLKKRGPRMLSDIEHRLSALKVPVEARDQRAPQRQPDREADLA